MKIIHGRLCLLSTLFLFCASAICSSASIGNNFAVQQNGSPLASTDSRKVVNEFGASITITSDADWQSRWNTPEEVTPVFSVVEKLKTGESAAILIFFTNPKQDASGFIDVTYDIKFTRPNRQITEEPGLKGFAGKLSGAVTNTFLTTTVLTFTAVSADPLGEWVIDVTVHDNIRRVSIPLRSRFMLVADF